MSLRLGNLDIGSGEEGEDEGKQEGSGLLGGAEVGQRQQQRGAEGSGGSVNGGGGGLASGADGARVQRASLMGIDMDVEAEDAEADVGSSDEEEGEGEEEGHSGGWAGGGAAVDDPMGVQPGAGGPGAVGPRAGHAVLGKGDG